MDLLEVQRLLVQLRGCVRRPCIPRRRRRQNSRRRATPRPRSVWLSSRKCPPQDSVRCSASRHINSPNSRKSATRPASSSDWLRLSPLPGTLTFCQNSSRNAGMLRNASFKPGVVARHAALVPHQQAQFAVETRDRALALDRQHLRSSSRDTSSSAFLNARMVVVYFLPLGASRDRPGSCTAARNSRRPAPASARSRRAGSRRGRRNSPRPARAGRAGCSSGSNRPTSRPSCNAPPGKSASAAV